MDKFRIGLIGAGGAIAQAHIRKALDTGAAEITAISDVNAAALSRVGEQLHIPDDKRYADYVRLIRDSEVDAVVSATPNDIHADVIRACIEANKPVMAEKPFTRTMEEAVRVMETIDRQPLPGMMAFTYRYIPAFRYAKELIASGKLGAVHHVFVQYLQGWGAPRYHVPFVWRFDKRVTGTGTLGDLGSHMIDLARYLIGEFEEVSARLHTIVPRRADPVTGSLIDVEVDDFVGFHARLSGDVMGVFQSTRNAVGSDNQHEVTVFGANGTVHAGTLSPEELTWIDQDETTGAASKRILSVPDRAKATQWGEFVELLRGRRAEGMPGFRDGYMNQLVMEAVIRSHERKQTVAVADIAREVCE